MPKTLAVLRADVRERLDESTATFWQDSFLNQWINEAARDIAREAENLFTVATVAVTAGVATYDAPANMLRIDRIEFTATGSSQTYTVSPASRQEADQFWGAFHGSQSSYPSMFILDQSPPTVKITLFRVPSQNGSLTVYYYRLPTEATADGNNVDVVEGWWDLIVDYCEAIALRKDSDDRWKDSMAMYQAKLEGMKEKTRAFHDQAQSIITPSGGMTMNWLYDFDYDG